MSVRASKYFFPGTHLAAPLMTSYSALCPILLGFSLRSLFNEALRAFYCILGACWRPRVHPAGSPYPTRATWAAHLLYCSSAAAAGTPMLYCPDQQLVPSLGTRSGLCFHSWLWGRAGGRMQVGRGQEQESWDWHEPIPHVSQRTWTQQRTCCEEKGTRLVSVLVSELAGWLSDLWGLTWRSFHVVVGRSGHGHSLNVRVWWQCVGNSCEFSWCLKIGH